MSNKSGSPAPDKWLGQYLIDAGLIGADELQQIQVPDGGRLWDAVVAASKVTTDQIVELLSDRFKLQPANLAEADPRAAKMVPESAARKYSVVPFSVNEKQIVLITSDPRDLSAERDLQFITGRQIDFRIAAPKRIAEKLDEFYRPEARINSLLQGLITTPNVGKVEAPAEAEDDDQYGRDPALDAPMAKLVDALITDSVRAGASDIHSELESSEIVVRYRVDGVLKEIMRLPASAGPALVRRVKIVSGLDVTNAMTPQDGRSSAIVDGEKIDLRVATAPVARRGEKLVIRILDTKNLKASIPDLALPKEEESVLMEILGHREGMMLVTGPTGSGKTTTLYAVLNHLKTGKVNIVTVEDPVEYDVDGISQMQVNEAQGFTFASALKSVLRQDPDIVLVGEIRDLETASISVQAGLTGHFVFSTLHTNDAPSAIVRLRDIGVDSFKIGSVVKGILAQRLVRRVCPECAVPYPESEVPAEARPPADYSGTYTPMMPKGCKACSGTGHKGRMAVMEVFPIMGDVPKMIELGSPLSEIVAAARPHGMRTLWESGLSRFWMGMTSFEEVRRVLGESNEWDDKGASDGVAQKSKVTASDQPIADRPGDGNTILIADDDNSMRRLLRTVLEREGFSVLEANDGLKALEIIETNDLGLMILDHDMPNLTGLGVLEEIRARTTTAGLPVIMLTARTDDTELHALDLGAQDFLTKPVTPRSMVARVKAVLKRTRMN